MKFKRKFGRSRKFVRKTGFKRRSLKKKFLNRSRRPKNQIKFADIAINSTTLAAATVVTNNLTTLSIAQGANNEQRIGDAIRIRKVRMRFWINDGMPDTIAGAPVVPDSIVRLTIWTPRLLFTTATTYITNNSSLLGTWDHNIMNVLYDKFHTIGTAMMVNGTLANALISAGTCPSVKVISKSFPFMRKAKFMDPAYTSSNNNLDPDKDVMYFTLISSRNIVQYFYNVRLFFCNE